MPPKAGSACRTQGGTACLERARSHSCVRQNDEHKSATLGTDMNTSGKDELTNKVTYLPKDHHCRNDLDVRLAPTAYAHERTY